MNQLPPNRVVLLTPEGRGAVASLRVEGPRAAEWIGRHFVGPKAPFALGRVHVGHWGTATPDTAAIGVAVYVATSEEVVVCRLEPEKFEVHCHGGAAASQRIIADLAHEGCSVISWRDWIGGEESHPIQAAARAQLADARTERTAAILLDQYGGALNRVIDDIVAAIESGDTATATSRLDELLGRAALGSHLIEPWRVVLAGAPNVGKSSLINALVGYRRSIVHDTPGTTRDGVSVSAAFAGWPVELIDTAGLRMSDDALENAGIDRARQQLASADAVLLVFDAAQPWTTEQAAMTEKFPAAIVVHNKVDLLHARDTSEDRPPGVATSALDGTGIEPLIAAVVSHLICDEPAAGAAIPFTASEIGWLHEARKHVERSEWTAAIAALRAMNKPDRSAITS